MEEKLGLTSIYMPSEDVVARQIQEEFVIIPITAGVGDLEDEIFSLNDSAKAVWGQMDGRRSLKQVASELAEEFEGNSQEIEEDVLGIAEELLKRKMLVEVKSKKI